MYTLLQEYPIANFRKLKINKLRVKGILLKKT